MKPCPFCGGAAEMDTLRPYRNISTGALEDACAIYCVECGAEHSFCYRDAPGVNRDHVIADVEARWNARPVQSSEERPIGAEGTDAAAHPGMNNEPSPHQPGGVKR